MEVDVGFPSQGEIMGIGVQGKVLRGWATWRGERLSLQVKCSRNEEYRRAQGRQGDWQTKAAWLSEIWSSR
jgi:hypothetical protein